MVQPKSTAILCGGRPLHNSDGYVSEKKIENEELLKLITGELWKKEKEVKEKKEKK